MSEEDRNNFKTYMVKEKDFTDLIIKDKEDNYYYSAIYVNELQQEIERLKEEKESWKRVATKNFNEAEDYKSIIKEVREILKFHLSNPSGTKNGWHIDIWNSEDINKLNELLEILDKGE